MSAAFFLFEHPSPDERKKKNKELLKPPFGRTKSKKRSARKSDR
jgi:hypothetical protein